MARAIAASYQHAGNAPDWMRVEVFFEMDDGTVSREIMPLSVAREVAKRLVFLSDPPPLV